MSKVEVEEIKDRTEAMTDDEVAIVLKCVKDEALLAEVERRYYALKERVTRMYEVMR